MVYMTYLSAETQRMETIFRFKPIGALVVHSELQACMKNQIYYCSMQGTADGF